LLCQVINVNSLLLLLLLLLLLCTYAAGTTNSRSQLPGQQTCCFHGLDGAAAAPAEMRP